MPISEQNGGDLAASRQRLARLLPQARASLIERDSASQMFRRGTELFDAFSPFCRENNIDRIEIYPAPLGGWHADLVLRNVPVGIPDAIGTPLARPVATREEAEQRALCLLVSLLALDQVHPDRAPDGRAVILVNNSPFYASLEELAEREASPGYQCLTKAEALAQLDQVPNTEVSKGKVVGWVLDAMIAGVVRYPASVDAAPTCGSGPRMH